MIILNINSNDENKLLQTAKVLLKENLVLDVQIQSTDQLTLREGFIFKTKVYRLMAKTKSKLFPIIHDKIAELFEGEFPDLFTVPIVHIDWNQGKRFYDAESPLNTQSKRQPDGLEHEYISEPTSFFESNIAS